jgi:hypothetical protein
MESGATQLTRMPVGPSIFTKVSTKFMIATFVCSMQAQSSLYHLLASHPAQQLALAFVFFIDLGSKTISGLWYDKSVAVDSSENVYATAAESVALKFPCPT